MQFISLLRSAWQKLSLMKINKKCKLCNKEFISYDCQKRQFCSKECRCKGYSRTFHSIKKQYHCIDCGSEVSRSDAKRCASCNKKFRFGKYSSCFKGGLITKTCKLCGKEFKVYPYRDKTAICCSRKCNSKYLFPKGCFYKHKHTKVSKKIMSLKKKGNKHPFWLGGISKLPYSFNFTIELKDKIRLRDDYRCKICDFTNEEHMIIYNDSLPVHHIDYNKQNCKEDNLITLCYQCHSRTNYNRNYWMEYLKNLLIELAVSQIKSKGV